ncbi:TrmH family RNA methyltransferase [Olivibacter sitiensis]|uniref:TrmH family RNA methyltransferase n=1 Tax=Olivibacter sitiensis TaxID=376470 RepID=UPI000483D074|nr:RNA methyltransferase [Olivibacter sitiensis]
MLSKSQLHFLRSLHLKKFRKEHQLFIAEGIKSITEFIRSSYAIETIYYTPPFAVQIEKLSPKINKSLIDETDLQKISALKTPQGILATIKMPISEVPDMTLLQNKFSIVLDNIQDPGNMGTIIRTADWFGIHQIICSNDTVEAYNPKVVQATMGSLAHVAVYYLDLDRWLPEADMPQYAAMLGGRSIYDTPFGTSGLLIMGNEGHGVRAQLLTKDVQHVTIPKFGEAESLNVAQATAIFCSEIKRNTRNF